MNASRVVETLVFGLVLEALLFTCCYFLAETFAESFRLAARYSGRLSLIVFLGIFLVYALNSNKSSDQPRIRMGLLFFAWLHLIHFGFLATNIYLNEIPIVPIRLVGGALAYIMICLAPLFLFKLPKGVQLVFFYYVTLVMGLTYLSRIQGKFPGMEPGTWHYFAMGLLLLVTAVSTWHILKSK